MGSGMSTAQPEVEAKKPFCAKCKDCDHVWIAAYYPMDMVTFGAIMRDLRCPMCGVGANYITPAKQADGVLNEERRG